MGPGGEEAFWVNAGEAAALGKSQPCNTGFVITFHLSKDKAVAYSYN
jgi:hypothetical protein